MLKAKGHWNENILVEEDESENAIMNETREQLTCLGKLQRRAGLRFLLNYPRRGAEKKVISN